MVLMWEIPNEMAVLRQVSRFLIWMVIMSCCHMELRNSLRKWWHKNITLNLSIVIAWQSGCDPMQLVILVYNLQLKWLVKSFSSFGKTIIVTFSRQGNICPLSSKLRCGCIGIGMLDRIGLQVSCLVWPLNELSQIDLATLPNFKAVQVCPWYPWVIHSQTPHGYQTSRYWALQGGLKRTSRHGQKAHASEDLPEASQKHFFFVVVNHWVRWGPLDQVWDPWLVKSTAPKPTDKESQPVLQSTD